METLPKTFAFEVVATVPERGASDVDWVPTDRR